MKDAELHRRLVRMIKDPGISDSQVAAWYEQNKASQSKTQMNTPKQPATKRPVPDSIETL